MVKIANSIKNENYDLKDEFKETIITTLYKVKCDPYILDARRTISLINFDYKIILMILTRRLDRVLKNNTKNIIKEGLFPKEIYKRIY